MGAQTYPAIGYLCNSIIWEQTIKSSWKWLDSRSKKQQQTTNIQTKSNKVSMSTGILIFDNKESNAEAHV